ncbi:MAG: tetratricopeptide repeat protein, partial [Methylococcales bacterium]
AKKLSYDPFFDHRIGDNLIFRNQTAEAEKLFLSLDLKNDVYANLRLAYFSIQKNDFDAASIFVQSALEIDYLDYSARMIDGVLRLIHGDYELAIQSFRVAAEERQGSASLYVNMAVAYIFLKQRSKAFITIKRAVALEPLNENAVMLFADLAFAEERNEDSLSSLKHFLEFEQKSPAIWARLARALLYLGQTDEAIAALKRHGSLEDSSAVWNNLGVAYIEQHNYQKAYGALSHALLMEENNRGRDYLLAARNICQLLAIKNNFQDLLKFSSVILRESDQNIIKNDPDLSDIVAFNLHSLWKLGKKIEFVALSESIIYEDNVSPRLKAWVVSGLITHYTSIDDGNSVAVTLSEQFAYILNELGKQDTYRKEQLINNIAYVYAEAGRLHDSERYINYLSLKIHKDPYPTATLGLLNFRKGNLERGQQLYSEAITLALNQHEKNRIRQKLNLELARISIHQNQDIKKTNRLLDKVINENQGSAELVLLAKRLKRHSGFS